MRCAQELERDRTKTYVVEISPLGLVEMTRQNVTDGPREILTRKCPTCAGDGIVVSDHTVAMQIERQLRALAAPGQPRPGLPGRAAPARARARRRAGRRPARCDRGGDPAPLLPRAGRRATSTRITSRSLAEGKLVDLQPASPLVEGSTVELKLGEVGRYDATAAAGQGRRRRRARRRCGEARRQEGDRHDRPRARGPGVRDARRRRRAGRGPDHVRERGREADAGSGASRKPTAAPDGEDGTTSSPRRTT